MSHSFLNTQVLSRLLSASAIAAILPAHANIQAILADAGAAHSALIDKQGNVWAWGKNTEHQLGDGTTTQRLTPVQIQGITNIAAIAVGDHHNAALQRDGAVWVWGQGIADDATAPEKMAGLGRIVAIAAGNGYTIALQQGGKLRVWGNNTSGQLGDGTTISRTTPATVSGNFTAIAAGDAHTAAIDNRGGVWAWGNNASGQLGDGSTETHTAPAQVIGIDNVRSIAAGTEHTVAIKEDGSVWSWGGNADGQLGHGLTITVTVPTLVDGLSEATMIAAGDRHTLALTKDGTVWAWGDNANGQLGNGTKIGKKYPAHLSTLHDIVGIAAGHQHSLAVQKDGTVWTWGLNRSGQLGNGTQKESTTPIRVIGTGIAEVSLAVFIQGATSGQVTSSPEGIYCPPTCRIDFPKGTQVILNATPDATTRFDGWDGACAATAPSKSCVITIDVEKEAMARFSAKAYALQTIVAGTGAGTVTGAGNYAAGKAVKLTAKAASGSSFAGWSPSPCAASFIMPSRELACIAVFVSGEAQYKVDKNSTYALFEVSHLAGLSTARGWIKDISGNIALNVAGKTGIVQMTLNADSLDTFSSSRNARLRGKDFFNVDKYPTMQFVAEKFTFAGQSLKKADGQFTLRGVTRPLSLKFDKFSCNAQGCSGNATATIKRSDFGMVAFPLVIGDQVQLSIQIEAVRAD